MRISFGDACQRLLNGEVIAVPTETVYGLAASLKHPTAIDRIFAIKGRPSNNPLIIHVANASDVTFYASKLPNGFEALAESFWPGPLTIVVPVDTNIISSNIRAGLPTAAFRIPGNPLCRQLIQEVGPIVMPSANLSGKPSATQAIHVESDFGIDFPVLDGGACQHGLESTILYYTDDRWQIIRLGAISAEAFKPILGYLPEFASHKDEKMPICPGQLYRHYAPKAKLLLTATPESNVIIGFSDRQYPSTAKVFLLGPLSNPEKIAENLYAILRQLDLEEIETAWVDMDFPKSGLWLTIAERLRKAASK